MWALANEKCLFVKEIKESLDCRRYLQPMVRVYLELGMDSVGGNRGI